MARVVIGRGNGINGNGQASKTSTSRQKFHRARVSDPRQGSANGTTPQWIARGQYVGSRRRRVVVGLSSFIFRMGLGDLLAFTSPDAASTYNLFTALRRRRHQHRRRPCAKIAFGASGSCAICKRPRRTTASSRRLRRIGLTAGMSTLREEPDQAP
jgi:hypothetical protein